LLPIFESVERLLLELSTGVMLQQRGPQRLDQVDLARRLREAAAQRESRLLGQVHKQVHKVGVSGLLRVRSDTVSTSLSTFKTFSTA
jgi:hypothetical protein